MKKKLILPVAILLLWILFLTTVTLAQSSLPPALQKIKEHNKQQTIEFSTKISFAIAFLAGMLGVLSPCILPFLPAYFSYTFKEKSNITLMTCVFFAGFTFVFVTLGIIAGWIGEQTILSVQPSWLGAAAGVMMMTIGIMTIAGKNIGSLIHAKRQYSHDIGGTFLFGMTYAVGWTACLGPILSGILGIGAILKDPLQSGILLFFYSLGNAVPLFVLAIMYDKYRLDQWSWIKGRMLQIPIGEKKYSVHSTNLGAGILLIAFGAFLVIFKNTALFNTYDVTGTREYFYSLQRSLFTIPHIHYIGLAALVMIIVIISLTLRFRKTRGGETNSLHP